LIDYALSLEPPERPSDLCEALGIARASLYRTRSFDPDAAREKETRIVRFSPRALLLEERETIVNLLDSPEYVDMAPPQIYTKLLDFGVYLASVSTMYRLLRERGEVRERRNQLTHPAYARPELMATGPNQLWSWDITKMRSLITGVYFYLYVIIDVFSRYIVGWTIQHRESEVIATELVEQTCQKQRIERGKLTIHADNGSAMISKTLSVLMIDLGVAKSHSRPHVPDDNPFSEAQFKTMKYRPDYPNRFASIDEARLFAKGFFRWYNTQHYHSGIAMMTPQSIHYGQASVVIQRRAIVLASACASHPERFVRKQPAPEPLPAAVWINKPIPAA
jgi:putative transposase